MFLDFTDEEHSKEWSKFFLGKVDAYAQCASAVGERLFDQSSLKEYSPEALDFIGRVTSDIIESANESIKLKYSQYN